MTAGLTAGIGHGIGLEELAPGMILAERTGIIAKQSLINGAVRTGLAGATGEDVGTLWRDEALSGGLALGQSVVGDIAQEKGFKTGSFGKIAMHSVTGGIYSAATGASPISGAIGGATSEFVAGLMESGKGANSPPLTQEQQQQLNNRIKATTKLLSATATLLAGGSAKDITTAGNVGESAIKHNEELHDKDREVLTATKEDNPHTDPEEYDGAILKLKGAMDTVNPDKDSPESVAELQRLMAKSTPEREAEIIDKAGDLGYEGLLDKTAWGKTKDYLVKEGVLKRGKGATQIYSSVIDLEGGELVDGFSKLTNFPISSTYSAITDVFSGKPITSDHIAVLMPYGSSHNASGVGEADRILQSLHATVHSPLLRTLDSAAEDFSVTTSKVILGGALVKYGYKGINAAAGTELGQYAIGKTDQALSYAASTKIGQTTTKVVSTTTNWAMELAGKTVKTKKPTVVTEASGQELAETISSSSLYNGSQSTRIGISEIDRALKKRNGGGEIVKGESFVVSSSEVGSNVKKVASVKSTKSTSIQSNSSASGARYQSGVASGGDSLAVVKEGDKWFRGTEANAAKIPKQIAEKMKGMEFSNFDQFRQKFWKLVADDPVLSKNFSPGDLVRMKSQGRSPRVLDSQRYGGRSAYEIHHSTPINQGGAVYDIDNLVIVTPKYHHAILDPKYHGGK